MVVGRWSLVVGRWNLPDFIEEAVGGLCPFEDNVRAVVLMKTEETFVEFAALFLEHAYHHFDAGIAKHGNSFAGNQGVRIEHADDNAPYPFLDDQFGAWGRFAVMGAGLEAHEEGTVFEIGCWLLAVSY